ncbi:Crp/Fnr family transcriptional regulator [Ruminococcus gauvreauii]|uniref:Crp/Fnr family transcriptional regulator n=1 Tax=Ruminococcus gauvreauii TaxID=438033 RepID=A0ABY5VH34_9FIRM|nr:Crp/Fnr family transcriptional regulator [Ruminococcus gauvreauii]UWP58818.1 Crp/Fnr family transcriptional regulator [Ruminococcus gauvreauii]
MDYIFLSKTLLFRGDSPEEIKIILDCLGCEQKTFKRGEAIYRSGDVVQSLGIVLSGRVQIENDDLWGNKSILDSVGPGQVFAETYACVPGEPLMVSVIAAEASEILFLNIGRVLKTCPNACQHHSRLVSNLLTISARKNLNLSRRIFHTSSKSIRGRLMSYLSFQAARHGCFEFTIPFNRQQLADYLSVDRSAMSNELSKMQREGLLTADKNRFCLKEDIVNSF